MIIMILLVTGTNHYRNKYDSNNDNNSNDHNNKKNKNSHKTILVIIRAAQATSEEVGQVRRVLRIGAPAEPITVIIEMLVRYPNFLHQILPKIP